jgi:hypothetical protein
LDDHSELAPLALLPLDEDHQRVGSGVGADRDCQGVVVLLSCADLILQLLLLQEE